MGKLLWTSVGGRIVERKTGMDVETSEPSRGFKFSWVDAGWLLLFCLLLLPYLQVLTAIWLGSGSRSSASLVAFLGFVIFSGLAFRRRPVPEPPKWALPAFLLLSAGTLIYVVSVGHDVIAGMGLASALTGSAYLYLRGGHAWLWAMRFPLVLYLLAIPIPGFLMGAITQGLLISATVISSTVLSWFLPGVVVQGFHIEFDTGSIAIVNSCSGLSGILLLIPLTVIFASLFQPVGRMRLAVGIVLALLLAFSSNLFRILATAFLVHWGSPLGTSESAHEVLGSIPILLSLGVLILFFYRSSKAPAGSMEEPPDADTGTLNPESMTRLDWTKASLSTLVVGCVLLGMGESRRANRSFDFSDFRSRVEAAFEGVDFERVRFKAENLLPDGYLCVEQSDREMPFFSIYVGYFPREALVEKSQHDPRVCYATLGWQQIGEVTRRTLESSSGETVEVQSLLFRSDEQDRVVWFWVQRGGASDQNEGGTGSTLDALWAARTDSTWVRLELDPELAEPEWESAWADRILELRLAVGQAMN